MNIEQSYELYVDVVYRFFYIKSFDKETAEDLTSQTFMILVERMQDDALAINDTKKFVYGVMRNVWLMHLRQKYKRNEQTLEGIEDFEDYVETTIEDYNDRTIKQRAEVFINQLPEKQRDIVTMRLLEEQSITNIGRQIGKDTNYVKTTYKRGIKRLRELMALHQEVV